MFNASGTPEQWLSFIKKYKLISVGIIMLSLILFFSAFFYWRNNIKTDTELKKAQIKQITPSVQPNTKNNLSQETILGVADCSLNGWKTINNEDWSGSSWFIISNNVWTLSSEGVAQDAVIYNKTECGGGTLIEYQVIPRFKNFLNINVYLRGQLRWEIGGRDRRSVRLWKNTFGCAQGEIKKVKQTLLPDTYLPDHDEILINQPLIIHMATYYLQNGLIRNEIWLTYASKNNNGGSINTPKHKYYYDFKVGSLCDQEHLPDINQESYQFGIGLQPVAGSSSELPRVSFDKFRISKFSYSD